MSEESEFCINPHLRSIGNCFECELYLEAVEEDEKEHKKMKEAKP